MEVSNQDFPVDDTTLLLLDAACQINPDSGHTELHRFLDMGSRVKSLTNEATGDVFPDEESALDAVSVYDQEGPPIFFVEHEEGYEPWSEHAVIRALVAEIMRLRKAS